MMGSFTGLKKGSHRTVAGGIIGICPGEIALIGDRHQPVKDIVLVRSTDLFFFHVAPPVLRLPSRRRLCAERFYLSTGREEAPDRQLSELMQIR